MGCYVDASRVKKKGLKMSEWYDELENDIKIKVIEKLSKAKTEDDEIRIIEQYHPRGDINLKPIQNLEEYFKYIRITTTDGTWFRGESCEHTQLIPKIFRNIEEIEIDSVLQKEHDYMIEFKRRSKSFEPNIDINDYWSWYFLAQHYGGPTRLLDWTTDAATALFMSLNNKKDPSINPIVYTLQPTVLTSYALKELGKDPISPLKVLYPSENGTDQWISNISGQSVPVPESPIALLPAYSDPRIVSQRSCFTLFGRRINGFYKDNKEIVCDCCGRKIRHKLIIDGTNKLSLKKELLKIGVSSSRVYPGLEGIAQELNDEIFG